MKLIKQNQNRPGYKETAIGWIPKEWNETTLSDVSIINTENLTENTNEKYSFYYLDLSRIENGNIEFPNNKIKYRDAPSRAKRILRENDIILATVRPYLKGFAIANFSVKDIVCSTGFALITVGDNSVSYYIFSLLFSEIFSKQFFALTVGSNYPALNNFDVERLKIPLPPLSEQKKIATILSTWDRAISNYDLLIKNYELRKKGLMQRLLTGKVRFSGFTERWQEVKLGEILENVSCPVTKPKDPYTALSIRSHCKGTFLRRVEDPSKIMMDTLFEVKPNHLILNITFGWEGAIAMTKELDNGALVSHRFPMFKLNNVYDKFFKYFILQKRLKYDLGVISPGGAGRNRVLSKKDFLKLCYNIPSINEQQQIGDILFLIDFEIKLLIKEKTAMEQQKKGLMQKLLTGSVRVGVDKD